MAGTARRGGAIDEAGRYAVLYPAIAEAAHRVGATAIGLIDVGRPAALNLCVDRVGITYSDGVFLGDPDSLVQESCSIVHGGSVPDRAMPPVVARVAVTRHRPDVEDALLAEDAPVRFCGDVVELLPEAIAAVPRVPAGRDDHLGAVASGDSAAPVVRRPPSRGCREADGRVGVGRGCRCRAVGPDAR